MAARRHILTHFLLKYEFSVRNICMRAVYYIMRDECALIAPLWLIVGDYVELTKNNMIEYALVMRETPDIQSVLMHVVDELDEYLSIQYTCDNGSDTWHLMNIADRLHDLNSRKFKCTYTSKFRNTHMCETHDLESIIAIINILLDNSLYHISMSVSTPNIETKFMRKLFDGLM